MKHYHVMFGLRGGYLPDSNEAFRSLREARSYAAELAAQSRDDGEKVRGSAKDGFYEVGEWNYIEIAKCNDKECEVNE